MLMGTISNEKERPRQAGPRERGCIRVHSGSLRGRARACSAGTCTRAAWSASYAPKSVSPTVLV